ncbi:hypothetical protein LDENG_00258020, partial [Lucifuga dentata]
LQLNVDKSETLIVDPDNSILKNKDCTSSLGSSVKSSLCNLSVMLDKSMSLDCHVRQLTRSSFFHLRNMAKLRSVVSQAEMEIIIHAFISSHLDYCNSLFTCLNKTSLQSSNCIKCWYRVFN